MKFITYSISATSFYEKSIAQLHQVEYTTMQNKNRKLQAKITSLSVTNQNL
jgi:hypothetical protein